MVPEGVGVCAEGDCACAAAQIPRAKAQIQRISRLMCTRLATGSPDFKFCHAGA